MSIAFALSMLSLEGFNMSSDCFQKNDQVRLAAYVNMGLAAVHMFFAIYIQFKLIRDFNGSEGEEPTAMQGGQGWALAKRMWHIILYDFVFCLYVPVALGSFGFGFYQFGGAHACSTDGHKGSAAAWFARCLPRLLRLDDRCLPYVLELLCRLLWLIRENHPAVQGQDWSW